MRWARDCRYAELDPDSDFGPEDMLRIALHGGYREGEDEKGFIETVVVRVIATVHLRGCDYVWRSSNGSTVPAFPGTY